MGGLNKKSVGWRKVKKKRPTSPKKTHLNLRSFFLFSQPAGLSLYYKSIITTFVREANIFLIQLLLWIVFNSFISQQISARFIRLNLALAFGEVSERHSLSTAKLSEHLRLLILINNLNLSNPNESVK